ncbi:hypothetical protein M5K25_025694 [Dendrobium thyrsiflorum]|uniref:Uncharacterized protein n=1 Tax=Dendrobium thyrsiflorum TaxID=117978 RepID=A0ABD0U4I9_DENTH
MAGRKVEVLEGELGQLKTDFEEKISDFQNQFSSIHEKMDGRFAALEDLMKKMIDDKQKPASSETNGGHGRGGNPNPSGGRENPEVEVLEGDDGMPPLEPLSKEELSRGYDRREADYVGRREEFYRRGAGFERIQRRGADFEGEWTDFHRRDADSKGFSVEVLILKEGGRIYIVEVLILKEFSVEVMNLKEDGERMPLPMLGLGIGGGCGVGFGLGWGFGSGFGSQYRSSKVIFDGIQLDAKGQSDKSTVPAFSKSNEMLSLSD